MKVSIVSGLSKNISFGNFRDDATRQRLRQILTADADEDYMQPCYDGWFRIIDKTPYADVYTAKDGTMKVALDEGYLEANNATSVAARVDQSENIASKPSAQRLAMDLKHINNYMAGVDVYAYLKEKSNVDDYDAEAERQARIDNLAQ